MKSSIKYALLGLGGVAVLGAVGGGGFVYSQVSAYETSLEKVYDVPIRTVGAATEKSLARGKHLAEAVAGCAMRDCHGSDLAGGKSIDAGPIGQITGPNITQLGLGSVYSDGELARLVEHGIKRDGRTLRFMPAHEISWLPVDDVDAIIAYTRSVPGVTRANGPLSIGILGKVLDRQDGIIIDIARRIDHKNRDIAPSPSPTAAYGKYIGRLCTGCHGATMSGGRIPGTPDSIPVPANITPHDSGLKGWSYADFEKLLMSGIKKDGTKLDPFMPIEGLSQLNETEKKALWAHLQNLPPLAFGNR